MANEIVIPKLGMTMASAKVAEWVAKEGDWVEENQIVLVIETEKVTYEVEALSSGYLHIIAAPDTVAAVGEAVGILAGDKEELEALQKEQPAPAGTPVSTEDAAPKEAAAEKAAPAAGERVKISPLAKKIAREHGLDYTRIKGSGPGGRIKKVDVEKALADKASAPATVAPVDDGFDVVDGKRVKAVLPLTGIRGVIADHMQRSLADSAQLTTMGEIEVGAMVKLRESYKAREASIGLRISYTDILVYILARALKDNPIMNSSLVDGEIKLWEDINIGVAVSLPWQEWDAGLVVPVIYNADKLSLLEISKKLKELREKAVSGTLALDEITGGTFTISNVGGFGKGYFFNTPIINQPQSAILGIGPILDRPVVEDGEIVVQSLMNISLTFDHRIINGAPIGKFLGRVAEFAADPGMLLL